MIGAGVSTTVLIIDDHAPFRRLARQLLEAEGFTVVGEAADGAGGLSGVATLRPQVVLLDLQLPDLSGKRVREAALGVVQLALDRLRARVS